MSLLSDFDISLEQMKKVDAEDLERGCFVDSLMRGMLSNARSEHQTVNQMDAEHQRVHQKTNGTSAEMIFAQDHEELQNARMVDVMHGIVEVEKLHNMLSKRKAEQSGSTEIGRKCDESHESQTGRVLRVHEGGNKQHVRKDWRRTQQTSKCNNIKTGIQSMAQDLDDEQAMSKQLEA